MNAALFVETRLITGLPKVINDHLKHLPGFELIIFHGRNNKHIFKEFDCQKYEANINSLRDYNRFMTDIHLWRGLEKYNRVLVFQSDSMILRDGIEEFLQYSFIGAPLYHIPFPCMNGGLSLRDPKAMINCINDPSFRFGDHNEDILFCKSCQRLGYNLPTKEIASKFSVETIFNLGSFALHAPEKWHTKEKVNQLYNQYV